MKEKLLVMMRDVEQYSEENTIWNNFGRNDKVPRGVE